MTGLYSHVIILLLKNNFRGFDMENFENIGYRMHYYKVLDTYTQICEQYGLEVSEEAQKYVDSQGSFAGKYAGMKDELKKILNNDVRPIWIEDLPKYFEGKEIEDAEQIITATLEIIPEDAFEIFARAFRTLNMLEQGHIKDVKSYVAKNIRYMTLDEIFTHYDFVFHSKFGNELLDGVFEEIKANPDIAPDVKDYFKAREDAKKKQAKIDRKNQKKQKRAVASENEKQ